MTEVRPPKITPRAPEDRPGRAAGTDEDLRRHIPLTHARLPRWAPALVAVLAGAASGLLALSLGWGLVAWAVVGIVLFAVALPAWSRVVENSRAAKDRLVTVLVWAAFGLALVPLVSLVWQVVSQGLPAINAEFLTYSMRNVVGEGGGIYHAIMGTLLITLMAAVISVPVGLLTAIYLVEYGQRSTMARTITFLVDVMTGIPSIVAGLFAYALFVLFFGEGVRMGLGGAVALSLLMIPVVVRSCEEMFKLVPHELREAAYALGVPKWRTIVKIVLPTAMAGIITGVTLAVARVIGETAPLLIIAGFTDSLNFNLFAERMTTLPVFIYYSYTQPGVPPEYGIERAWGAALVLIVIVMALNLLARVLGKVFAPKSGR
ncbi:phosphate ABC transporter permease PstA [Nocardioides sp. WL0053]|uniref:Phosphate transport system permease protein PstA n=1 Tax=Nocardioides jiangsuensis TaxID=2866161 RepID=A0ABS7RIS2_9ACTN|nr:phosphate ABC transporter permease PstA [Nocardioides jiangsuensis]MBY9074944.1 phosphate ABC transporter permease PstA [Nocardioides jiangsuensis]